MMTQHKEKLCLKTVHRKNRPGPNDLRPKSGIKVITLHQGKFFFEGNKRKVKNAYEHEKNLNDKYKDKNINVDEKKYHSKKRKKYKLYRCKNVQRKSYPDIKCSKNNANIILVRKFTSIPNLQPPMRRTFQRLPIINMITPQCLINGVTEFKSRQYVNPFEKPSLIVYRCQFNIQEESCCCSCNSDAMFEVMKSLYDCYKKKNCDNCHCILCAHLPKEERRLGELRKSGIDLGKPKSAKEKKKLKKSQSERFRKAKEAGLHTPLEGKTNEEKEKILRGLVKYGQLLPEGKTESEKALVKKVRADFALPPKPITAEEKERYKHAHEAGFVTPLEGKSNAQKEKILRKQAEIGLVLPEGRTASEKQLIAKIKSEQKAKPKGREIAAGLTTPLEGKSSAQKEKIIRELAMQGLPLPEMKTSSDKALMNRVRKDIGLPAEPKSESERNKYNEALAAGAILPLEGKTLDEKENILRQQYDMGIQLPEGRTPSEKDLIRKIKSKPRKPKRKSLVERLRKAKTAGASALLEGKTPNEKEQLLRELAMQGVSLLVAKTASDKALIEKVRFELGLPKEPKNETEKANYDRAEAAGIIIPLEGKTKSEKEMILRKQHGMGIQLAEGRTTSEKALIKKIQASPRAKLQKEPLQGKTNEQKREILKGLAMQGIPLPKATSSSERAIMDQVREELGLPPEPKTASEKLRYKQAEAAGVIVPLEGMNNAEKEKIIRKQAELGLVLPKGRTASEKDLIKKVADEVKRQKIAKSKKTGPLSDKLQKLDKRTAKVIREGKGPSDECICNLLTPLTSIEQVASDRAIRKIEAAKIPSEKLRKAKEAGLLSPLEGKTRDQKEKIIRGLIKAGVPIPEGRTASEKAIVTKVRAEMGLPQEPKTRSMKVKYDKAVADGTITPLEGKTNAEKEKILRKQAEMGLTLPEGRTRSEKALIKKIQTEYPPPTKVPSAKLRKAKETGLLTPLEGKSKEQKAKIMRGLVKAGIPIPEAKTASEKAIATKVRAEMGLPPEPKTRSMKVKYDKAVADGTITPLDGKTNAEKENILRKQAEMGFILPEGRTKSEKALIKKIKTETPSPTKVPSEKLRKAKETGLLTPLEGKMKEQKEQIIRGLVKAGIPIPEARTASEKAIVTKVRAEMGLPPEPKTRSMKVKYDKAVADGTITPLDGKTNAEKEKILRKQAAMGFVLPEGRTKSEKALIKKIQAEYPPPTKIPSEKLRKAQETGLLTPLEGKTKEQKKKIIKGLVKAGIPIPEGRTASEKAIVTKVRAEMGLPPEQKTRSMKEKYDKAVADGTVTPLEGKTKAEKEKILRKQAEMGLILPEGRTKSEKALIKKIKTETPPPTKVPSEKLRKAKETGLLTPLEGKTREQKEQIIRGLVKAGIPIPEARTASEKAIVTKVRAEMGLPPEPKTRSMKVKYDKAVADGTITPLDGKTNAEKEKILRKQAAMGFVLPEGRTKSEKALIKKIQAEYPPPTKIPSEKLRKAQETGLLTPLEGKTKEQKKNIIKGLVKAGIPIPEGRTASEKAIVTKVRAEMGLPPEQKTRSMKEKYDKAVADGTVTPLEGKTKAEKEKILRKQAEMGLILPEGRTKSEKALIKKIKTETPPPTKVPSEKLRKAKETGLLTPLEGKSKEQKEKIIRGLIKAGIPIPEGRTASEKALVSKVRAEMGLPPEPKTRSMKVKYDKAVADGTITPLEGKTNDEKEKILRNQALMGFTLPEGRTKSERNLIKKIQAETARIPSEKLQKAREAGLLTPLEGKTAKQKENILKGLIKAHLPLPEASTTSEKELIKKVRKELGLPPEPDTQSQKVKQQKALASGIFTPLEGKTAAEKEKILTAQFNAGVHLPEGRTQSEKELIRKIKAKSGDKGEQFEEYSGTMGRPVLSPDKAKKLDQKTAKVIKEGKGPSDECICGLLTPESARKPLVSPKDKTVTPSLKGTTLHEKENYLKNLAMAGQPLPVGKSASEKELINKVRRDLGLPPEPKSSFDRDAISKAHEKGLIIPLEGKSAAQKEKILKDLLTAGVPLPKGRTSSEKALIRKVLEESPVKEKMTSKIRKAQAAGLLTPLEGKGNEEKENILRKQAKAGIPLPEGKTQSEKAIIQKIRNELGLPPEPITVASKEKMKEAYNAGIITPLEGKTTQQKERILKKLLDAGITLPKGRTASEKALIKKVKTRTPSLKITTSEKMRTAQAAGVLTPLEGKNAAQKEKILRGLAKAGIPLPEAKTSSEKELIRKVKADMGLPPDPKTSKMKQKIQKAYSDGIITPLEGKTTAQKEKILKRLVKAGIPLPEGRTASEKALVKKVRDQGASISRMDMKTPKEKEKALTSLAKKGAPLPEGRTPSEKELIRKIRTKLGLPPEPKTSVSKIKMHDAYAAGIITPLDGKTTAQKEKILKKLHKAGISLPEGRTASEKALIKNIQSRKRKDERQKIKPTMQADKINKLESKTAKVLKEGKGPSDECICDILFPELEKSRRESAKSKISSEKMRKAKAAGLLTPLEGKTRAEKEKIIKALAKAGMPLPEGKTASEKSIIRKIAAKYGIKSDAKKAEEERIFQKAKERGLLTPLAGKPAARKEKIVQELIELGLPVPEGKTKSEKEIIKRMRVAAGLPPEPTPSERKGKIRTRSKKIGMDEKVRRTKGIAVTPSKQGILEEFEDIVKTTTCDRGCGCDKKKIRFKHSYVKIRVTSPDISNLCPCPEECVPGVKHGVLTDNEGIKVTVGTVLISLDPKDTPEIPFNDFVEGEITEFSSGNYESNIDKKSLLNPEYIKKKSILRLIEHITNDQIYNLKLLESHSHLFIDDNNCLEELYFNRKFNSLPTITMLTHDCAKHFKYDDSFEKSNYEQRIIDKKGSTDKNLSLTSSSDVAEEHKTLSKLSSDNLILLKESESSLGLNSSPKSGSTSETFPETSSLSKTSSFAHNMEDSAEKAIPVDSVTSFPSFTHNEEDYIFSNTSILKNLSKSTFENIRLSSDSSCCLQFSPENKKNRNLTDMIILKVIPSNGNILKTYNQHDVNNGYTSSDDFNGDEDVLYMVEDYYERNYNIRDSSSLFILIPSLDEQETISSDDPSSNIYIAVSNHSSIWLSEHTNLHLQQNVEFVPRGIKIFASAKLGHSQIASETTRETVEKTKERSNNMAKQPTHSTQPYDCIRINAQKNKRTSITHGANCVHKKAQEFPTNIQSGLLGLNKNHRRQDPMGNVCFSNTDQLKKNKNASVLHCQAQREENIARGTDTTERPCCCRKNATRMLVFTKKELNNECVATKHLRDHQMRQGANGNILMLETNPSSSCHCVSPGCEACLDPSPAKKVIASPNCTQKSLKNQHPSPCKQVTRDTMTCPFVNVVKTCYQDPGPKEVTCACSSGNRMHPCLIQPPTIPLSHDTTCSCNKERVISPRPPEIISRIPTPQGCSSCKPISCSNPPRSHESTCVCSHPHTTQSGPSSPVQTTQLREVRCSCGGTGSPRLQVQPLPPPCLPVTREIAPCKATERTQTSEFTSCKASSCKSLLQIPREPTLPTKACQCDKKTPKESKARKTPKKKAVVVECECPSPPKISDLIFDGTEFEHIGSKKKPGQSFDDMLLETFLKLLEEKEKQLNVSSGKQKPSKRDSKGRVSCVCSDDVLTPVKPTRIKKGFFCECPVVPPPPPPPKKQPTGIKFSLGAKGSGSKGLSGLLCFE